jgi:hypothetical protein
MENQLSIHHTVAGLCWAEQNAKILYDNTGGRLSNQATLVSSDEYLEHNIE